MTCSNSARCELTVMENIKKRRKSSTKKSINAKIKLPKKVSLECFYIF
jgi:hypothetical protein